MTSSMPKDWGEEKMNSKERNKLLLSYGMRSSRTMVLGFIFSLLAMGLDLVGPYVIGRLLDQELVNGLGPRDPRTYLILVGVYLGAIALSSAFAFLYTYYFNKTANKVAKDMQEDVFAHLQKMPISYFDSMASGRIVARITGDTRDVKDLFRLVLSQMVIALVYALGIYISLFAIDPRLFVLGLVPLPIIIFVTLDFKNKSKKYNYSQRRSVATFNADLKEDIEGMEIIQAFNEEDYVYEDLDETNRAIFKDGLAYTKLFAYSGNNAIFTIKNLSLAVALFYFAYQGIRGQETGKIGLYYVFANYITQLFDQLRIVVLRAGELERSFSAADHIFELLGLEKEEDRPSLDEDLAGQVQFDHVSFSYDGETKVLDDIDFSLESGRHLAVVGQTGSGKSTIMNLLFGFYEPDKGKILIGGKDASLYDKKDTRKIMSIVLQENILFTGSLRDNITLFDESISDKRVEEALVEVGGQRLIDALDKGIHTPITNAGDSFSSGERQIISFARALVVDPEILVLDEATSNIDSETEAVIQEGIKALGRGRTMLVIAHRLSTIKDSDKILVLSKGRIAERGNHDDLILENGIYKEMYEAQSKTEKI